MNALSMAYELDAEYEKHPHEQTDEEKPGLTAVSAINIVGAELQLTRTRSHIVVWVRSTCRAQALLNDLEKAGFILDPYRTCTDEHIKVLSYSRAGTGPMESWTQEEKKRFTSLAKGVLKRHGVKHVRSRHLSPSDIV